MEAMINAIEQVNDVVNSFVWGPPMLILLLFVGIYFSIRLRFFQIRRFGFVFKETICATFSKKTTNEPKNQRAITQFQALAAALALQQSVPATLLAWQRRWLPVGRVLCFGCGSVHFSE